MSVRVKVRVKVGRFNWWVRAYDAKMLEGTVGDGGGTAKALID